jgi:hypothetical protein
VAWSVIPGEKIILAAFFVTEVNEIKPENKTTQHL